MYYSATHTEIAKKLIDESVKQNCIKNSVADKKVAYKCHLIPCYIVCE